MDQAGWRQPGSESESDVSGEIGETMPVKKAASAAAAESGWLCE
jgi:hypothetical protein